MPVERKRGHSCSGVLRGSGMQDVIAMRSVRMNTTGVA